jgi:membrane protein DedA with SNARE-associated domain
MRVQHLWAQHGYLILLAFVLAEQIGLPIPATPALLAMGAMAGEGKYGLAGALLLSAAAVVMADSTWYVIGRFKGNSVLKLLCRISIEPDSCVSQTRSWFRRLGGWALVVAKFIPGLSTVAAPMAGLTRMTPWRFLVADASGGLLWASAFLGLGFAFHDQLEEVGRVLMRTGARLGGILATVLVLWIAYKFYQRRRFIRTLRGSRITAEEVQERLQEFVLIDLRQAEEVAAHGKLPGALWFDRNKLAQYQHEIPRDRDLVVYCS